MCTLAPYHPVPRKISFHVLFMYCFGEGIISIQHIFHLFYYEIFMYLCNYLRVTQGASPLNFSGKEKNSVHALYDGSCKTSAKCGYSVYK